MKKVFLFAILMVFTVAMVAPAVAADTNVVVKTSQSAFDNDDEDPKAKKTKKDCKKSDCKKKCDKAEGEKKCDKKAKASSETKSCCKKDKSKA